MTHDPSLDAALQTMVAPEYDGGCVANLVPALLEYPPLGDGWVPDEALAADQVVLFVVDGLGWQQLQARAEITPTLTAGRGGPITTIAPTTTAAALTSITTGSAPGEHGVVGYRIRVGGETMNALRWTTGRGDVREHVPPRDFQRLPAFGGRAPVVVNKGDFVGSGFTLAHLDGVDYRPYSTTALLVHEVAAAVAEGHRFVYTYYDGLDRVGHERGHGSAFDAEFGFVDRLVADLRAALPDDVVLLITADHGQVDTGEHMTPVGAELLAACAAVSGEDRFLWLHAPGAEDAVLDGARAAHGEHAWVLTVDEVLDAKLLGTRVTSEARNRLGDVALIAKGRAGFVDPSARNPRLFGRHGSLTPAEMYVPLLAV